MCAFPREDSSTDAFVTESGFLPPGSGNTYYDGAMDMASHAHLLGGRTLMGDSLAFHIAFAFLGVDSAADEATIRRAFRARAQMKRILETLTREKYL